MSDKKPVNVFLEGKLGKLFGREWKLFVDSPGEALRAININLKGKLQDYLTNEGAKKYYKIAIQKKDNLITPKEEINNPSGQGDIYIIPTIKGSSSGVGKIILGAVLIVVGVLLEPYSAGWSSALISAGIGMVLGGVVQLLTPIPKINQDSSGGDQRNSTIFQGNSIAMTQGSSVGIVYGRALVAPMPISMSSNNENVGTASPIAYGNGSLTYLAGEGVQWQNMNNNEYLLSLSGYYSTINKMSIPYAY